jgi:hypothetical protein
MSAAPTVDLAIKPAAGSTLPTFVGELYLLAMNSSGWCKCFCCKCLMHSFLKNLELNNEFFNSGNFSPQYFFPVF